MSGRAAFLTYGNRTWVSRESSGGDAPSADTPVTRLIESIWDHHPEQAFHLLRSRIFTNYPLTLRCRGSIQLAAKRVSALSPVEFDAKLAAAPEPLPIPPALERIPSIRPPARLTSPGSIADWMATYAFSTGDRKILALIADPAGRPLLACANRSSRNRLRHAEVNLLRAWTEQSGGTPLPAGSTIWVSLKPCRMCAGFIHDLSEDGARTRVIYLEDDPGPKARHLPLTAMVPFDPAAQS